jgi:CO/xanthine dehydrogenase Mo-binding subunit
MSNPSIIRMGLGPDGRVSLYQGAVDIGQGSNTVIAQIAAQALGAPIEIFDLISADTDQTPDAGKTSASRQTFVSGGAAARAGQAMRAAILRLANAGEDARLVFESGAIEIGGARRVALAELPLNEAGFVVEVAESFDPPTTPLDANGQGEPYAVYGSGAHLAEVEVDVELGRVKVLRLTCAHDVGRAINPTLVEG